VVRARGPKYWTGTAVCQLVSLFAWSSGATFSWPLSIPGTGVRMGGTSERRRRRAWRRSW
jgi:hypothetical protein